jgi:uncharacterized phage protein (TIGR02218 family)
MRLLPMAVQTKLDGGLSTFACCWKLTRKDEVVMRFTNFHDDLVVSGQIYKANTAIIPSTLKQTNTTSVDNMTVSGILSSVDITVRDILAERYDFAEIEFFLVDYKNLAAGPFTSAIGSFGEIQAKGHSFETELRLLIQRLVQKVVEVTSRDCRVTEFGDSRCQFNAASVTWSSTVSSATTPTRSLFQATGTNVTAKSTGYFARGKLTWITGDNAGINCDVKASTNGTGEIELQKQLRYDVQIGDQFTITAGCDRRFETCRDKFNNVLNYQGEPHIRGTDYMVRSVVRDG